MADIVNLRNARKQAKRQQGELNARANRTAHGRPKHLRNLEDAQQDKATRDLDRHRIEKGDR